MSKPVAEPKFGQEDNPVMSDPMPEESSAPAESTIVVCVNRRLPPQASCAGRGSESLADYMEAEIVRRALPVRVKRLVCLGHCQKGPTVRLVPGGRFLFGPSLDDLNGLLDQIADRSC
ncbi:(2Fe-2S) ferredoxin domain-containing protein [Magnetospira sp. QH-2]|uniref:(2Fe-2S) ferredoxin domain-containing protein n=1 Tax=Magnetospira sp. (strain QH-2) TaxID=1288970 RepID=UPI0003E81528|nr:(2Fe-2S) ferredoxin domain-containing protein [Magnetospira sp. QH-2]CCQ73812.1 Protein of unknown function. Containing ferredoxin, 2Fe-2s domain [Magnetospira sp. QH-2]